MKRDPSKHRSCVILAFGSDGDVLPLISVGAALKDKGHDVKIITTPNYKDIALLYRLDFVPVCSIQQHVEALKDTYILNTRYTTLFFVRHARLWNTFALQELYKRPSSELMVISIDRPLVWADIFAHQHLGIPVIRAQIDPPLLIDPLGQALALPPGRIQRSMNAMLENGWRKSLRSLNNRRCGWNHLARLVHSGRRSVPAVALWPEWLTAGGSLRVPRLGFVPAASRPSSETVADLFGGHIPECFVVFICGTLGTTDSWVGNFLCTVARVCESLSVSGLVLGVSEQVARMMTPRLGDEIVCRTYFPLDRALPYARAVVHHGGIGTAARAIAEGIPQVILPRLFSQSSNAEWLRRQGLCIVLDGKANNSAEVTASVNTVVQDSRFRSRALELAGSGARFWATDEFCRIVQSISVNNHKKTMFFYDR